MGEDCFMFLNRSQSSGPIKIEPLHILTHLFSFAIKQICHLHPNINVIKNHKQIKCKFHLIFIFIYLSLYPGQRTSNTDPIISKSVLCHNTEDKIEIKLHSPEVVIKSNMMTQDLAPVNGNIWFMLKLYYCKIKLQA